MTDGGSSPNERVAATHPVPYPSLTAGRPIGFFLVLHRNVIERTRISVIVEGFGEIERERRGAVRM